VTGTWWYLNFKIGRCLHEIILLIHYGIIVEINTGLAQVNNSGLDRFFGWNVPFGHYLLVRIEITTVVGN
jgi:hypothetical protein